jgi:hypothetical protein
METAPLGKRPGGVIRTIRIEVPRHLVEVPRHLRQLAAARGSSRQGAAKTAKVDAPKRPSSGKLGKGGKGRKGWGTKSEQRGGSIGIRLSEGARAAAGDGRGSGPASARCPLGERPLPATLPATRSVGSVGSLSWLSRGQTCRHDWSRLGRPSATWCSGARQRDDTRAGLSGGVGGLPGGERPSGHSRRWTPPGGCYGAGRRHRRDARGCW